MASTCVHSGIIGRGCEPARATCGAEFGQAVRTGRRRGQADVSAVIALLRRGGLGLRIRIVVQPRRIGRRAGLLEGHSSDEIRVLETSELGTVYPRGGVRHRRAPVLRLVVLVVRTLLIEIGQHLRHPRQAGARRGRPNAGRQRAEGAWRSSPRPGPAASDCSEHCERRAASRA